jgi:hypothetical protein
MCGYLVVLLLGFISVLLLYSSPQMPYLCGCDCWAFLVCHCELLNINISSEVCVCFSTKFFAFRDGATVEPQYSQVPDHTYGVCLGQRVRLCTAQAAATRLRTKLRWSLPLNSGGGQYADLTSPVIFIFCRLRRRQTRKRRVGSPSHRFSTLDEIHVRKIQIILINTHKNTDSTSDPPFISYSDPRVSL